MNCKIFGKSRKILTLYKKVKGLEMYDKNSSSRTAGEAFGVNKDQIQKLVKCKAGVLEEYSGNEPSHSRCIRRKTDNDEINKLIWRWFQDATTTRMQVSGPLIQRQALKCAETLCLGLRMVRVVM